MEMIPGGYPHLTAAGVCCLEDRLCLALGVDDLLRRARAGTDPGHPPGRSGRAPGATGGASRPRH